MSNLIQVLQGQSFNTPPLWLMRQAGRYLPEYQAIRRKVSNFMDLCFDEELATEVTLQPIRRFSFDAAILFCDILVIPHVLGQKVTFIHGHGPVLEPIDEKFFQKIFVNNDLLESLSVPLNILRNVRTDLPHDVAVIGFAGSPWTIATYMLEEGKSRTFSRVINLVEQEHPLFIKTMALLEETVTMFLIAQINAGADIIQIFDSWAKAMPLAYQKKWIVEPVRRIISNLHKRFPDMPVIYYGRGVIHLYSEIARGLTNIAFGIDEDTAISHVRHTIAPIAPVQGNLRPQTLVEGGNKLVKDTLELLETFAGTPYIFNLGHGILPQTPVKHVEQLVELVRKGLNH